MEIHKIEHDQAGAGRWEKTSGRYIPVTGGSRSRLPVSGPDPEIRRYYGLVGIDERLTPTIYTIAALYQHMGGAPKIEQGKAGALTARIQDVVEEQRRIEQEALAAAAKAAQIAQLKAPTE